MSDDMMDSPEQVVSSFSRSGAAAISSVPATKYTVSNDVAALARTNLSRIVNGMATHGRKGVADIYEKDVSTIAKWLENGQFERMAMVLAALGLKVVPSDWECLDMAQVNALLTLNRAYVINLTAEKLVIDLG